MRRDNQEKPSDRQRRGGGLRSVVTTFTAFGAFTVLGLVLSTSWLPALAQSGRTTVLEYDRAVDLIAQPDSVPMLRVYDDGLVHAHYPAYMRRAGDYEIQLSAQELEDLFLGLATDGATALDLGAARAARDNAETALFQSTGELFHVSDSTHTVIVLRPTAVPGLASVPGAPTADTTVRWPNVQIDSERFPTLDAVQAIAAAERRLQALLDRAVKAK